MTFALAEGLVDTLKTYIEANLAAKLAALDAEYPDSIALENTVATYVGIKSLRSIPQYPVLYVISPNERFHPRSVTDGDANVEAIIGVVVLDPDAEVLHRRLYRYGRALVELMMASLTSSAMVGWVLSTDEDWEVETVAGEFTEAERSEFVGEVSLSVRAKKLEIT